jgi:hypothetical protein
VANVFRHIIRGALSYFKYHGQDRPNCPAAISQYDIVLTTYGTLAADFCRSRTLLERINWYRMILDEGTPQHHSCLGLCYLSTDPLFFSTRNSKYLHETIQGREQNSSLY